MIFPLTKPKSNSILGHKIRLLMKDITKNIALPFSTSTGNNEVMSLSINLPSNIILLGIIISLLGLVILG
jgi:hypothetical protein